MRAVLVLLLTFAACAAPTRVAVDHQPGLDGAWQVPEENAPSLDATKDVATLRFMDRFFVFEMEKFRGFIDKEEVSLYGDGMRINLTPELITVEFKGKGVKKKLAELPKNRRIVYRNGEFLIE